MKFIVFVVFAITVFINGVIKAGKNLQRAVFINKYKGLGVVRNFKIFDILFELFNN